MKTHELKIQEMFYFPIKKRLKTFEIRYNDRDYEVGDILNLNVIDSDFNYTGDKISVRVNYIMDGGKFGVEMGYIVMGISKING
jgi:hypothetical protein